jgi:hypothetical protein
VRQMAVFLSGVTAAITGVFIRSCSSGIEMDLASAWCGKQPPPIAALGAHAHCAGCAVSLAGLVAMGLAAASLVIRRNVQRANVKVRS